VPEYQSVINYFPLPIYFTIIVHPQV